MFSLRAFRVHTKTNPSSYTVSVSSKLSLSLCLRPQNGSMILYNRKKVKYRKDGYCWKKRKDGKTTREDHMKLKVQGVEVRGCSLLVMWYDLSSVGNLSADCQTMWLTFLYVQFGGFVCIWHLCHQMDWKYDCFRQVSQTLKSKLVLVFFVWLILWFKLSEDGVCVCVCPFYMTFLRSEPLQKTALPSHRWPWRGASLCGWL